MLLSLELTLGFSCHCFPSDPFSIVCRSLWFAQCQKTFTIAHAQAGPHPELRIIFHRLARLLQGAVIPIFVFDGPDRPPTKRGTKVLKKPHWLTAPTQELIIAFGFHWYTVSDKFSHLASTNENRQPRLGPWRS